MDDRGQHKAKINQDILIFSLIVSFCQSSIRGKLQPIKAANCIWALWSKQRDCHPKHPDWNALNSMSNTLGAVEINVEVIQVLRNIFRHTEHVHEILT